MFLISILACPIVKVASLYVPNVKLIIYIIAANGSLSKNLFWLLS